MVREARMGTRSMNFTFGIGCTSFYSILEVGGREGEGGTSATLFSTVEFISWILVGGVDMLKTYWICYKPETRRRVISFRVIVDG